ncbi:hypothetical protein FB157_10394 [Streptomyces sp. BK340]|nr:hypothetical protein FB157_10394 [Streptomyces sp. BK340]
MLCLTDAGQELVESVLGHRRTEIRSLVERLPAQEHAGLVPALRALTAAAAELDLAVDPVGEAGRLGGVVDDPINPAPWIQTSSGCGSGCGTGAASGSHALVVRT